MANVSMKPYSGLAIFTAGLTRKLFLDSQIDIIANISRVIPLILAACLANWDEQSPILSRFRAKARNFRIIEPIWNHLLLPAFKLSILV